MGGGPVFYHDDDDFVGDAFSVGAGGVFDAGHVAFFIPEAEGAAGGEEAGAVEVDAEDAALDPFVYVGVKLLEGFAAGLIDVEGGDDAGGDGAAVFIGAGDFFLAGFGGGGGAAGGGGGEGAVFGDLGAEVGGDFFAVAGGDLFEGGLYPVAHDFGGGVGDSFAAELTLDGPVVEGGLEGEVDDFEADVGHGEGLAVGGLRLAAGGCLAAVGLLGGG